jgi:hypothetical protein
MNRWISLASIVFALSTASARAQELVVEAGAPAPVASATAVEVEPRNRIGIDAAFLLPLGDYAEAADFGIGALARWEMEVTKELSFGARAGYIHVAASELSGGLVPIHGTARYRFGAPGAAPYLHGEIGLTVAWASVETPFGNASDSESRLSAAFGGGYELGIVDLGVALYLPDIDEDVTVLFTAGVDLARF